MIFKSVEIIVIEEDSKNQKKIHNPMYIPVTGLSELLTLSKKQLEMKIIQSIEYQPKSNTFAYKPYVEPVLTKVPSKKVDFQTPSPLKSNNRSRSP